jgi:hypothetical protein
MNKKYEITDIRHPIYTNAFRIRSLQSSPGYHGARLKPIGGYVDSESCLSHEGSCWIEGDAVVIGSTVSEGAVVSNHAFVKNSVLSGDCRVGGHASVVSSLVTDVSNVEGNADIKCARVLRQSVVRGFSVLKPFGNSSMGPTLVDARVQGLYKRTYSEVVGDVTIHEASLLDDCRISNPKVLTSMTFSGRLTVNGLRITHHRDYATVGPLGSEYRTLMAYTSDDGIMYTTGCFTGTYEELVEAITDKYYAGPSNLMYRLYMQAIELLRTRLENLSTLP